jgi:hypothetical protein
MKHSSIILSLAAMSLVSCGKSKDAATTTDSAAHPTASAAASATVAAAPAATSGKYKLESGIVTSSMEMPSMKQSGTTVLYFDKHGAREALETISTMKIAGNAIQMHQLRFNKDGYVYMLDLANKTGVRTKGGSVVGSTNMADVSESLIKEYHIKKEGTETIAGKTCDMISMDDGKSMKGHVSTWNGITMKTDVSVSGMPMKTVVTKIEENSAIPDSKFEVPAGITVKDM